MLTITYMFSSSDDMEMCSLKVLELEGSPSLMLLRLMGERGCTTGHLMDYLQTLGNSEALQCLKPPGRVKPHRCCYVVNLHFLHSFYFSSEARSSLCCLDEAYRHHKVLLYTVHLNQCKFTVIILYMCSPPDPHSAPVCIHYMWPQSAAQLPCCGQVSSTVPVVQI